ncbi:MAG TPA: AI-2E family transporter [Microbacteriaceae bacterium]|nr:AI-2E family transporter [Microbacteriaceae bacterium]
MRILNPFRTGLFAGLGVLVAIGLGAAFASIGTIITYIGAALFLALGLDPMITWLETRKVPRWAAIIIVLVAFAGLISGLVFAIIPVVADQVGNAIAAFPDLVSRFSSTGDIGKWITQNLAWLGIDEIVAQLQAWLKNLDYAALGLGVLNFGITVLTGLGGALIVLILTIYFTASTAGIKRTLYRLVPASKRPLFIEIAEEVSVSVGRFVMGQGALGLLNGVLTGVMLGVVFPLFGLPVDYWALLAFLAMLGSMIPLVGTIAAVILNTLLVLLFNGPASALAVGIYAVVYMQLEAYFVSPRIMAEAVKVPGPIVIIAALAGGALLGLLGALIAIPVAAAIILIINKVYVPRQDAL